MLVTTMRQYPIFCGFDEVVTGRGFIARIVATGRALAAEDLDGWWMYGVNPGAMAVPGKSLNEAHLELREAFRKVLLDFASDAANFKAFKNAVEKFFAATNVPNEHDWLDAVRNVRNGELKLDDLPRVDAGSPYRISVMQAEPKPATPEIEEQPRIAA
jgi:hypothetical protein